MQFSIKQSSIWGKNAFIESVFLILNTEIGSNKSIISSRAADTVTHVIQDFTAQQGIKGHWGHHC